MKLEQTLFVKINRFFELEHIPYEKYNRLTKFIPSFILSLMWKFIQWDFWRQINKHPELRKELKDNIRKALEPGGCLRRRMIDN